MHHGDDLRQLPGRSVLVLQTCPLEWPDSGGSRLPLVSQLHDRGGQERTPGVWQSASWKTVIDEIRVSVRRSPYNCATYSASCTSDGLMNQLCAWVTLISDDADCDDEIHYLGIVFEQHLPRPVAAVGFPP